MSDPFEACAAAVRKHDPDSYFSALFAPADKRPLLFALYAFNHELAHVGESVREPMIGEIRLAWWREALDGARSGTPRNHDVVRAMADTLKAADLPDDLFGAMIDARQFDLMSGTFGDFGKRDDYLDATSCNVMRLAARILGAGDRHDSLAKEAGLAYGIAGLLRNQARHPARRILEPEDEPQAVRDAQAHLARARTLPKPRKALAAFLPAALVPLYLHNPAKDVPVHRRQLRLLGASMRGRI